MKTDNHKRPYHLIIEYEGKEHKYTLFAPANLHPSEIRTLLEKTHQGLDNHTLSRDDYGIEGRNPDTLIRTLCRTQGWEQQKWIPDGYFIFF